MASLPVKPIVGDCDACDAVNVPVYKTNQGLFLCTTHYQAELTAYEKAVKSNPVVVRSQSVNEMIISKNDVFTAPTVSMIDVYESIMQDESIPSDKKDQSFVELCHSQATVLKKAIFDDKIALKAKEDNLRALEMNIQSTIGKLRAEEREKYKQYDITYEPPKIKKIKAVVGPSKPSTTSGISPQAQARAARDAAAKYPGLSGAMVQATASARHMSYDEAAKFLADSLR